MKIGLLALQGNYQQHSNIISKLGLQPVLIRYPQQLEEVSGLIIPGGESTTMSKLIDTNGFRDELRSFSQHYPILGTCAGLIMMGRLAEADPQVSTLDVMDVTVRRNGYGRQLDSFMGDLTVTLEDKQDTMVVPFIRAPRIEYVGADVEILASYNDEAVAIRQGHHIGLTFHPEHTDVTSFHQLAFLG
jgi:5'-phosphate synthase pdxT subunit